MRQLPWKLVCLRLPGRGHARPASRRGGLRVRLRRALRLRGGRVRLHVFSAEGRL